MEITWPVWSCQPLVNLPTLTAWLTCATHPTVSRAHLLFHCSTCERHRRRQSGNAEVSCYCQSDTQKATWTLQICLNRAFPSSVSWLHNACGSNDAENIQICSKPSGCSEIFDLQKFVNNFMAALTNQPYSSLPLSCTPWVGCTLAFSGTVFALLGPFKHFWDQPDMHSQWTGEKWLI